jgi:hypothetical protein
MSRKQIQQLEETVEPFVFEDTDGLENGMGPFPFPIMADVLLSEDWEETEQEWFVDTSGFGRDDESALTMKAFREQLIAYIREHLDHGFALTGVGQFQAYVTAFRKKD